MNKENMTSQIVESEATNNSFRNNEGILIRCPTPICRGRIWRYHGTTARYATCSSCRRNVNIPQNRIERNSNSSGNPVQEPNLNRMATVDDSIADGDPL